uniref:Uncharacterized protein n=1 Tax=Glossina brevipalpis TaxID=37001 RepID=A0A1A9X3B3_9MUSC
MKCFMHALAYSDKLKAFEDAVNDAKLELENLKSTVNVDDDEDNFRQRRKSANHIFESHEDGPEVEDIKGITNHINEAAWSRVMRGHAPYTTNEKNRLLKALRARDGESSKRYNFNAALFNRWGSGANFRKSNALSNGIINGNHEENLPLRIALYSNMNGGGEKGTDTDVGGVDGNSLTFHKNSYSTASLSGNGPTMAKFASASSPFKTELALGLLKNDIGRNKGGDEINLNYRIPPASKSMMAQSTIYGSKMDNFRNYGRTTKFPLKNIETITEQDNINKIMYEDGLLKPEAMNAFAYLNRNHFRFDLATTTERLDYSRYDKEREELEDSLRPFKYPIGILRENITESPYEESAGEYSFSQTEGKFPERFLTNSQISRLYTPLNDQFETKKNNLSHEADYKLSKMEQDASERYKGHNVKWENGEMIKRSSPFNPMDEIKLKTSRRLMRKGYGPSLPSYSLSEARKELLIDHMLQKKEQELTRGAKKMRSRMSDRFFNSPDYYDSWMDANEHVNEEENMGIQSNEVGMDDLDMNDFDYIRRKRISHCDPRIYHNSMNRFKTATTDDTTANPIQDELNKKAHKSKNAQTKLKSSGKTESQKDEKAEKEEKGQKNDDVGNEKKKSGGKWDKRIKVRHKNKKEEKENEYEKKENKQKLEKVEKNERTEKKGKIAEKDKTEKTERPITKSKGKMDQDDKFKRFRTQRQKNTYKTLLPEFSNEDILVARDEDDKLQSQINELGELRSDNISPDFEYTNNIQDTDDQFGDRNRQFAMDVGVDQFKHGEPLELDSGINDLINEVKRVERNAADSAADSDSHRTEIRRRKRSVKFGLNNKKEKILGKFNSIPGSKLSKNSGSSIKQGDVACKHVSNSETTEESANFISNLNDVSKKNNLNKVRPKRSLGTEREEFKEKQRDFDTIEHNDDNISQRYKRSLQGKLESLIRKPHRMKRHSLPYLGDDYMSHSKYQLPDMGDDTGFLSKLDRQKQETIHDFDFDSARKSFGREEFDNLKQKDPKFDKFNGMKFDNMMWDKSFVQDSEQKSADDKNIFMDIMNDRNQNINNDISTKTKKEDGPDFNYNLRRNSENYNDDDDKTLQETFNTDIKPDYRNFWLATGNSKREDNKLNDIKVKNSKMLRTDSKNDYLKGINDLNQNYKFNENHFNWGQHYNNFKVENNPYFKNWLTNKRTDNGLSLNLHNDLPNYSAFSSLDNFLKTIPRNVTVDDDSHSTVSSVVGETEPMPGDLLTRTTPCVITTTRKEADTTTECVTIAGSDTNATPTSSTTQKITSVASAPSKEEECITTTTETILTTTTPEIITEIICEESSEKSTEKSTECIIEETTEVTESRLEECTESPSSTEKLTTPEGVTDEDQVKLNITISANVVSRPKEKTFLGNGTINVIPGYSEDRNRRETYATPFEEIKKRKSHHHQSKASESEDVEDINNLASGKLSSQVVKSVFCMVQNDPKLKALWPSLKRRQPSNQEKSQAFYAIRKDNNEEEVKRSEKMLQKAMDTINCIIEEQVRSRNCVPLRPDLQNFYETVLRSNQERDKGREKRDHTMSNFDSDFSKEIRALDPNKIEEKSRIVKKLLKQYEELPQEDQEQVVGIRDDLLKDLLFLRKLNESEERRRRELFEKKELGLALNDDEAIKRLQSQYTPQFLKLLKASDLYREIANEPETLFV